MNFPTLRTVQVLRYVTPLREGGSLPAIVDADDEFLYVLKFRGAGQGTKALIADLLGAELFRALGFKVPELVFAQLDHAFGRTEPDPEIQELLRRSEGLNLALHYLSGAITFDPVVMKADALMASKIVWLDSFLMNVDRTARNTNMLCWNHELWLIDHGASLYFHHAPDNWEEQAVRPFTAIKDHVLLPQATKLEDADAQLKPAITPELLKHLASLIPEDWLDPAVPRERYVEFLQRRLDNSQIFLTEAINAGKLLL
ncbi:MAG: aminotransferase class I and II [Chitinophagaceae bacterium]|nr:aminotransferase class I and II [Chitinophagaceae bacterium]